MKRRSRSGVLSLLLLIVTINAADLLWRSNPRAASGRPNIILVSVDAMRSDRVDVYRSQSPRQPLTPNLDGLARNGVVFERAFAQASWTYPSHVSMFMGRHPASIPLRLDVPDTISTRHPLLASRMAALGYETAASQGGGLLSAHYGFDRGFSHYWEPGAYFSQTFATAMEWLQGRHDARPFFLFVHGYDAHPPLCSECPDAPPYNADAEKVHGWFADPHFAERICDDAIYDDVPLDFMHTLNHKVSQEGLRGHPLTPGQKAHLIAHYENGIRQFDKGFGTFLEGLRSQGLSENTVIMVVADHGWDLFEHGYYRHFVHGYRCVAQVPMIVSGAGIPQGRRCAEAVGLIDVVPTLLSLAGAQAPQELEGQSLLRVMASAPAHRVTVTDLTPSGDVHFWRDAFELALDGDNASQKRWLHLYAGPLESVDLSNQAANESTINELLAFRDNWRARMNQACVEANDYGIIPQQPIGWKWRDEKEEREYLRKYGYSPEQMGR
ncbi:MAG: hypothetical protein EB084_01935 [Proteobacteria bacterium]|nr:hypothetical protein [Pseudomonadota bacterium]